MALTEGRVTTDDLILQPLTIYGAVLYFLKQREVYF